MFLSPSRYAKRHKCHGYIEDEVLFSFLPKTKIERLLSLSIFSFVYVVQTLAYSTTRFVNLVEPVHVLCLVAAGTWNLFLLKSPAVSPPSSLSRS